MFNYFLPGRTKTEVAPGDKLDPALLAQVGLASVLADCQRVPQHASVLDVRIGPNGKAGVIIAPVRKHSGPPDLFYDPALQTWTEVRPGKLWLGVVNGAGVSVRDLERFDMIGGAEVRDDAGNAWLVPIARAPQHGYEFGTLPQSYTFDATGEPSPNLAPSYAWLWDLAGEIRDWYVAEAGPSEDATPAEKAAHERPPLAKLVKYAARILGVNYRLGFAELNVLHQLGTALLTQRTVHAICQACYGWEVLEEAKKKPTESDASSAPNSSPSTTGESTPGVAPATDQAAEH